MNTRAASLSELLSIDLQATEWMRDGLCAQTDPEAFFPDENNYVASAKAVCAVCPVLAECRSYALETDQRFGVWGGLSAYQRRQIRTHANRTTDSTRPGAHPAKNVRQVGAPNTQQSGETPMVGTRKSLVITAPRRARAITGYGSTFESGKVDGHPWPLEYAPRWTTDHHPWRIATAPTNGIRFASYEIVEAGGRDA